MKKLRLIISLFFLMIVIVETCKFAHAEDLGLIEEVERIKSMVDFESNIISTRDKGDNTKNAVKLQVENYECIISAYDNEKNEPIRFNSGAGDSWIQNGKVGIGTRRPDFALDVESSSDLGQLRLKSTGAKGLPLLKFSGSYNKGNGAEIYQNSRGEVVFNINSRHPGMMFKQNQDVVFYGKVGIGTKGTDVPLEVVGTLKNTNGFLSFVNSGGTANIGTTGGDFRVGVNGAGISTPSFYVNSVGKVGIGTAEMGDYYLFVNREKGTNLMNLRTGQDSGRNLQFQYDDPGNIWKITSDAVNGLAVNTSLYQTGSQLYADYVFDSDYKLETIKEHAKFMWKNKHLRAIPKVTVDKDGLEIVEIGSYRKGIVEELEKAHIYIEQLYNQNKLLEERLSKMESLLGEKN